MRFDVLPFDLGHKFKRVQNAMPFPRGAVTVQTSASTSANGQRFGVFGALGAIGLGGLMMTANLVRERHTAQAIAETPHAVTAKTSESPKATMAAPPVKAAETGPTALPSVAKTATRIDMTSTGSIEVPPPTKLQPKPRKAKKRAAKSEE